MVFKKVKQYASNVYKLWRIVAVTVIFIVLTPVFWVNKDSERFFPIVLSISIIAFGIAMIVRTALSKKLQKYVLKGLMFLGSACAVLACGVYLPMPEHLATFFLLTSALLFALSMQWLGVSALIGII